MYLAGQEDKPKRVPMCNSTIYMTFWKRQNYSTGKQVVDRDWGRACVQRGLSRIMKLFSNCIEMVWYCTWVSDTTQHLSKPTQNDFIVWINKINCQRIPDGMHSVTNESVFTNVWQTSMEGVGNKRNQTKLLGKMVFGTDTVKLMNPALLKKQKKKESIKCCIWSSSFSQRYNLSILKLSILDLDT